MQRQGSFSQAEYAGKKKQTRRDKFLADMEQVVPWGRLVERLRPFYPMGERGRRRVLADWNYETQFAPVLQAVTGGVRERTAV